MQDERNINIDKATRDAGKDLLEELLRVSTQGGKTTQPENKASETTKKIPSDLAGLLHFFELIDASIEEAEKKRKEAKEDDKAEAKGIKKDASPSSSKSHCCLFDPDWFSGAVDDDPLLNANNPEAEASENDSLDLKEQEKEKRVGEEKYGRLFRAIVKDNFLDLNEWIKQTLSVKVHSENDKDCQPLGYDMKLVIDKYYNALCDFRQTIESIFAKLEYLTEKYK